MSIKKSQFTQERLNIKLPKNSSKSKKQSEIKIIGKSESQNAEEKLTFVIDANADIILSNINLALINPESLGNKVLLTLQSATTEKVPIIITDDVNQKGPQTQETFESYLALRNYVFGNASADFNKKFSDVKFKGGCNEADIVASAHKDDYATVTKEQILNELHEEYLKSGSATKNENNIKTDNEISKTEGKNNSTNNTIKKDTNVFSEGIILGAHGLTKSLLKDCFYKISDNLYVLNPEGIKHRFPNSNISTLDDLVKAYRNNEMVYTEKELLKDYSIPQKTVDFLFIKNEDGTYSRNAERFSYGCISGDIPDLGKLSDVDIEIAFSEKIRLSYHNKSEISGSEIKKNLEYNLALYKLGYKKSQYSCDEETLNNILDLVFSKMKISDIVQYNLSDVIREFDSQIDGVAKFEVQLNSIMTGTDISSSDIFESMLTTLSSDKKSANIEDEFTYEYCKSLLERINNALENLKLNPEANKDKLNALSSLSEEISEKIKTYEIIQNCNETELAYILDDNTPSEVVARYIDNNYKDIIGNHEEFMQLVNKYYDGANKYSFEDCAKFLIKILTAYDSDETPDIQITAKLLGQLLKTQDKDCENYQPLFNALDSAICKYLENNENISTQDFLKFCKENNIYEQFRTEEEINAEYSKILDEISELFKEQASIIQRNSGYEPDENSEDGKKLAIIKQKIEDAQYKLNTLSIETSRENAEATFEEYFIKIIAENTNTNLTYDEVKQLLKQGTNISVIFDGQQSAPSKNKSTTQQSSSSGNVVFKSLTKEIHSYLSDAKNTLRTLKDLSSSFISNRNKDNLKQYTKACDYCSNLMNAYNDPKAACNTIAKYMGISTNFVSALFSYFDGKDEDGARSLMLGTAYSMSPIMGGILQNIINITTAIEKYKADPEGYGKNWKNISNLGDAKNVSKLKLITKISLNVLAIVGNAVTGGLLGAVESGLKTAEKVITFAASKILKTIDKWSSKLLGKPLTTLLTNLWQHSGAKKLWQKTGLKKIFKKLGLTKLWNKIFKPQSDKNTNNAFASIDENFLRTFLNDLSSLDENKYNDFKEKYYSFSEGGEVIIEGKKGEVYKVGEDTVMDTYSNDKLTGKIVIHKDGSIDYYEIDEKGNFKIIATKNADGKLTYVNNDNGTTLNEKQDVIKKKYENGEYGFGQSFDAEAFYSDCVSAGWKNDIYITNKKDAITMLYDWFNEGKSVDDFFKTYGAGTNWEQKNDNDSGQTGGSSNNSGNTTGGYCPDGSWSPIAGSGWGSVMDGVIGVGGHGGTPVLGGGGGRPENNSYH